MKKVILSVVAALALSAPASAQVKLTAHNIDEVVKAMTVEEKVDILIGCGQSMGGEVKFPGTAGRTRDIPRLGIPSAYMADGPHRLAMSPTRAWDHKRYDTTELPSEYYTYQFIVDGLKTTDPANVYINRDVATVTNYFIIKNAPGDKGDLYSINKVPHGTVRKMWYYSKELGTNRRVTVYTPAGYETSGKKYPVFYLLHGAGGDEEAWYTQGRTTQILDNLIATGKAEPMIVVMTNGNAWQTAAPGESAEGFAQPSMGMGSPNVQVKEAAFELHFPDVINFIQKNFRTYTDKKHRAIAGLSMGSFHSENISKYYPTMFNYVGLFSGANVGGGLGNAPATSDVYTDFDAKMAVQFSAKNKPALYMICCGKTDFVKKGVDDLRAYMIEHNYPFEYMETEGGHIWRNWRVYLSTFAPRLFK